MVINLKSKAKRVSFTIIEVLVVISILATLGVNSYSKVTKYFDKPKDLEITRDLKQYQDAITCLIPTNKPFTEENINKYLDPSLQFTGGLSNEENPYGNKYKLEGDGLNTATVVSEGKENRPESQEVINVNKSNGSAIVNNATKYDKAETIKNLARSLGFVILDKTVEESQPHYEELYNNFTANTKSLIDRIAGKKQAGDSTYDVTPAELEVFGNELSSAITDLSNGGQFMYKKRFDLIPFQEHKPVNHVYENFTVNNVSNIEYDTRYKYNFTIYSSSDSIIYSLDIYIEFYSDNTFKFFGSINTDIGSPNQSFSTFEIKQYIQYFGNYAIYFGPIHNNIWYDGYNLPAGISYFTIQIGDEIPQEQPVIKVGQMNISELISALQASGALNSQGAVTQQFITNYSKLPSLVYNNDTIKTIVANLEK